MAFLSLLHLRNNIADNAAVVNKSAVTDNQDKNNVGIENKQFEPSGEVPKEDHSFSEEQKEKFFAVNENGLENNIKNTAGRSSGRYNDHLNTVAVQS